jgi:hypothetical protein
MHQEAVCKALYPAQAGSIALDADSVTAPFIAYVGTDFQEVAARSADIWLPRRALLPSAGSRINKASAGSRTNKEEPKQCNNKK